MNHVYRRAVWLSLEWGKDERVETQDAWVCSPLTTQHMVEWAENLSWGPATIVLACGQICGSTLLADYWRERATPGQVALSQTTASWANVNTSVRSVLLWSLALLPAVNSCLGLLWWWIVICTPIWKFLPAQVAFGHDVILSNRKQTKIVFICCTSRQVSLSLFS